MNAEKCAVTCCYMICAGLVTCFLVLSLGAAVKHNKSEAIDCISVRHNPAADSVVFSRTGNGLVITIKDRDRFNKILASTAEGLVLAPKETEP